MFTLAANEQCPHCKRFVGIVNQIPPLQQQMNLLTDVSKMKNELGITHVPTVITQDGQRYEGEAAFVWLKQVIKSMGGDPNQFSLGDIRDPQGAGGANGDTKTMVIRIGIGVLCAVAAYYLMRRIMAKGKVPALPSPAALAPQTPTLEDAGF